MEKYVKYIEKREKNLSKIIFLKKKFIDFP
jgi:hypothetical protein